jgi:hypothetical protein
LGCQLLPSIRLLRECGRDGSAVFVRDFRSLLALLTLLADL